MAAATAATRSSRTTTHLAGRAPDRRGHGYLLPHGEVLDYFPPNV